MIERLTSSAVFPVSGATLRADYQPQTGITAVVGENGAGKTFLSIETTRWLLYGKAALRGAAGDYKDAQATGRFTIRGAHYEVSRGKAEWIKDGSGEVIAKGAEKVTEKVTELMGYGLDVFDLCNAATQGNVQALGAMRPAQRKALIDSVLRLTDAESAEKACREEAKGYKREAEALAKTLRAPGDEPVTPPGYMPAADLRAALQSMRAIRDAHAALRGQLRLVEAPVLPQVATFSEEAIAELERYETERNMNFIRRSHANRFGGKVEWTAEQLDAAAERRRVRQQLVDRGDKPTLTREEVEQGFEQHRALRAHTTSEPVTCPKCDHTFRPTGEAPPEPTWPRIKLEVEEQRLRAWPDDGPALPEGLDLSPTEIAHGREQLQARAELDALPPEQPSRADELNRMRQDKATLEAFLAEQLRYERVCQGNAEIEAKIAELGTDVGQDIIDSQAEGVHRAEMYEAAYAAWQRNDQAFKDTQAKITEASFLADEYTLGAKGIADARAVVKALIAPKISRIATKLIIDMSMGKLSNLIVDDEMEITVGGQRIETLSGAGKTVANLALRVAMGQALVGHVFPVFLADEIDGDLSATRRAATLQALVSLKKHLSQIILVTHRGAEIADQVWDVETTQ